jgi:glucose/arabinose dehydrogenase
MWISHFHPGHRGSLRRAPLVCALGLLIAGAAFGASYSLPGFSEKLIAEGLSSPTDFAFTPDGRILILEKAGRVRLVASGVLQIAPVLDIASKTDTAFERGLVGICLHPTFESTGWIYLYYATNTTTPPTTRISRFTLTGNAIDPASETVILGNIGSPTGFHNGGTILVGPDGKLWLATGDSGQSNPDLTSKSQTLLPPPYEGAFNGKVLRMELDGSPASGNPFLGDATKEPRIWAYGFRNPFRFSFRPSNGSIFLGDVGQDTREELDVGVAGGNFGWPYLEGTFVFTGPCPPQKTCLDPVFEYERTEGRTIIGGVFVTASAYPAFLQGKYLFGDWVDGWIRYLEFDSNDSLVSGPHDVAEFAGGPVAFHEGPEGRVYYLSFNSGRLHRIDYGKSFYTVTACRLVDTREAPSPWGGPKLEAGADRVFTVAGQCEIPPTATVVSANLTVSEPTGPGHLVVLPSTGGPNEPSSINFGAGQTRANNAMLTLGPGGTIVVRTGMAVGGVHFILDVNGYFD